MMPMEWLGSLLNTALRVPLRVAVRAYFHRVTMRNAEHIPAAGPLLIVANHPATLTEVFLLTLLLRRRLHFLAGSFIFTPWIRGAFMRLIGALPIYRRQDDPQLTYRNEDTFRACHDLFDRGGAVLIFPEGESRTDRRLLPLKTGAARLALGYEALPERRGRLRVVPVGLYFSDRTQFRSEAIVTAGPPIDLAPYREMEAADPQEPARRMTADMQRRLESLILTVPNDAVAAFVHDVERLYMEDLREQRPGEEDLALLRRTAECIHYYRTTDPERVFDGWRRTAAYRRKLRAVHLEDAALQGPRRGRTRRRRWLPVGLGGILGAVPAVAGWLINFLPYRTTNLVATRVAPEAIRISAARMVAGSVLFPLTWGLEAAGLRLGAGWPWGIVAAFLVLCAPLGYFALVYVQWLRRERERLRVALIASRNRRLLARLRRERKALIRLFDEARTQYLAQVGSPNPFRLE